MPRKPPPPPPRPDPPAHTARVTLMGHCEASPWANVFHVSNSQFANPSPPDLQALVQWIGDAWGNRVLEDLSHRVTLEQASVLYQLLNGDVMGAEATFTHAGDDAAAPLPANCALVISWTIQQRYRGGHPRTYLPGVPDSSVSDNTTVFPSLTESVRISANQFQTDVEAFSHGNLDGMQLGTVSFQKDNAWRTPPVFRAFTAGQARVDSRIDSQRRRLGPDR